VPWRKFRVAALDTLTISLSLHVHVHVWGYAHKNHVEPWCRKSHHCLLSITPIYTWKMFSSSFTHQVSTLLFSRKILNGLCFGHLVLGESYLGFSFFYGFVVIFDRPVVADHIKKSDFCHVNGLSCNWWEIWHFRILFPVRSSIYVCIYVCNFACI